MKSGGGDAGVGVGGRGVVANTLSVGNGGGGGLARALARVLVRGGFLASVCVKDAACWSRSLPRNAIDTTALQAARATSTSMQQHARPVEHALRSFPARGGGALWGSWLGRSVTRSS
jgi:hypothetical protein